MKIEQGYGRIGKQQKNEEKEKSKERKRRKGKKRKKRKKREVEREQEERELVVCLRVVRHGTFLASLCCFLFVCPTYLLGQSNKMRCLVYKREAASFVHVLEVVRATVRDDNGAKGGEGAMGR